MQKRFAIQWKNGADAPRSAVRAGAKGRRISKPVPLRVKSVAGARIENLHGCLAKLHLNEINVAWWASAGVMQRVAHRRRTPYVLIAPAFLHRNQFLTSPVRF